MFRQFRTLLVVTLLLYFPWQICNGKTIQRSCSAYYEFTVRELAFRSRQMPPDIRTSTLVRFGNFSAAGSCGRSVPNRCRQRARSAAHACMQSHWSNPPNMEGLVCPDIPNYPLRAYGLYLQGTFHDLICRTFRADEVIVDLSAVTVGEKDCGQQATLARGYRVICE